MDVPVWQRLISLVGLLAMVGIAWLLSKHRDRVSWRVVGWRESKRAIDEIAEAIRAGKDPVPSDAEQVEIVNART